MIRVVRACARALLLLVLCVLWPSLAVAQLVTGIGPGSNAVVRVIDSNGTDRSFLAYPAGFGGGANVALGDVNGDGVLDIITGAGPGGGPHVRVWDGVTLLEIGGFFAYYPEFGGGVSVAAGDVDGDGRADIITGAGPGGWPHVRVWSGADFHEIGGFLAYAEAFAGGVHVAAGDVDGDGRADIITGAGPGGGPHVRVWSGADFHEIGGFFAYDPAFPGGVHVAAGDVNGDGVADIITGAGPGGSPQIRVWNGATFAEIGSFFAYDPAFTGGATVGAIDLTYDGRVEIITAPGPGAGPLVAIWSPDFALLGAYFAFDPAFTGGVSIGSPGSSNALRFTSATSTTFSVATPGTFTVTTAGGGAVPTLTVTGALPAGVTFIDNGDRTGTLAGTPAAGTGGSYPLTFTATSGSATPVTQAFTLTVSQAPAITSAAATTFGLGGPGTFTVTTTGFPAPTLSSTGALPAGVTFTDNGDGTATLAGTPAPGSGGSYPLTITAANGTTPDATQAFVLTVNSSPAFTSANATTFTVGTAGTFAITTIATPAVTSIARTGAALPTGVTYVDNGNGTATLSGTPAAGTGGIYTFTLTASNGVGTNAVQTFTLTVHEAPAFTSAAATTFVVGAAGTFTVTTTGEPDVTTITIGGAALPAGVTFVNNGDGTATLSGTPGAGTGGTYALTFTINNGVGGNVVQNFTLTVNQAPAFTSATATTFSVGVPGTFTVTTSGVPPVSAIARTGAALPTGITYVDNANGTATLSGTPAVGTGGVYAFTFTINNGVGGNVTQSFTLTVTEAPVFTSAAATTFIVGTPGTFTVTTTAEPDVTLITLGGVALPAGVTFVNNGNGTATLSGTPGAGTGGTYALTFTANNGIGGNVVQNFTLTVNQAPAFTSADTTTFTVGSAGSFTVTTSGVPTVATITRSVVALPGGVTFVDNLNGTGTLSGTPIAGSSGAYVFTFTAANGVTPDAVQTFTLNVNEPPLITSANNDTFIVGTADSFTVTTTGFPTPTVSQTGTLPTGITFTPATRVLGGTATQIGAFPLVFTAANGVSPDATQNFTLNVVCPAITVSALSLPDGLYQIAYGAVDFNQAGSTGSSFTWSATGLPAGIVIDAATGVVSGTPTNTQLASAVAITVTDNFGCTGVRNTTLTVRPTTDNESYAGGVGNTQYVVSAAVPTTPHVFVVDNVKNGDNGPGALTVVFGPAVNGIVAEGPTDGTFTYTPNVNFAGPTDTFSYTLTDGNGVTNTATVTINLSGLVWYVNGSGANGDGRSHSPFNTVTNAQAPSGDGQVIYVHTGGATTTGTIALKPSQTLWGAGATFTLNNLTILGSGSPTLTGTITLANGVLLNTFNVNGSGGPAITGTNVSGTVGISSVNVVGGTSGINLTTLSGTLTFTTSAVVGVTPGASLLLSGGTATVFGRLNITSTAGRSVDIQGKTAGTVTVGGAIIDTGAGIFLNNNTGATINFTGGMAVSTSANPAFTATGGGTVSATQDNVAIVNTLATTTGTALNVANTTIGATGLTFRSISANGGANGIVLNNTGATGGLTVAGNGGACTSSVTCTGGSIQNTTGVGILLTSTSNVSLTRLHLQGTGDDAIRGSTVNNLTLNTCNLTNNGNATAENGLQLGEATGSIVGITGTLTITNTTIRASAGNNVHIRNTSGTLASMTVTGSTFNDISDTTGANSFLFEMSGTAVTTTASISTSTFANNSPQRALEVQVHETSNIADFDVSNNTFTENGIHASFTQDTTANLTFAMLDNTMTFANPLHAINVFSSATATGGTIVGTIQGNIIGTSGVANSGARGNALRVFIQGRTVATLLVSSNTIRQVWAAGNGARGLDLQFVGPPATGQGVTQSDVTITNNDVDTQAPASSFPLAAIYLAADDQGSPARVRANITGNIAQNSVGGGSFDYPTFDGNGAHLVFVEVGGAAEGQLVNTTGAPNPTAQLTNANPGTAAARIYEQGITLIAGPIITP